MDQKLVTSLNEPAALGGGEFKPPAVPLRPIDPTDENALVTEDQLAAALSLPNKYAVRELRRKKRIPFVPLGYRTYRYSIPDCIRELKKNREVKALSVNHPT